MLVTKKDGSIRICVDYRKINAVTHPDPFPMPRIEEMIDSLAGARYLTTLDLTKGYWQVPVGESSRPKTAFVTPLGKYQFKVMPFGLVGEPAIFQRMMNAILGHLTAYVAAYMDDVVIYSSTWQDHLQHIQQTLAQLGKAGLTVKLGKCRFGLQKCPYLGHVVGRGQLKPIKAKIEAVAGFITPKKKKDVRSFLGLAGYYWKFIPGYSTIATPLTDLTRKELPDRVIWKEEQKQAFDTLKKP